MSVKPESFTANFAAAEVEEKHMSPRAPSSVGASDLGRLALERSGSSRSNMVVTTRSGAKREAATRGESSRSSAAQRDKGKQKQKESGSSSRPTRKAGQSSKSSTARDDPGDDDESDDDDDDDDESDDEEEQRPVPWSIQKLVMALYLPWEPSFHCLSEFMSEDLKIFGKGRSERSIHWRQQTLAVAESTRTREAWTILNARAPLQGPAWSKLMREQLRSRWNFIAGQFGTHIMYCREGRGPTGLDVDEMIDAIKGLFAAVAETMAQFREFANGNSQHMIDLLLDVFANLPSWAQEWRPPNSRINAGGFQHFEYNLLLRFAASQADWQPCLNVISALGDRNPGHFRRMRENWRSTSVALRIAIVTPQGQYPGETGAFVSAFHRVLTEVGVSIT